MRPSRILFVNHVSRMSGAEQGLINLVKSLAGARFEVTVALPAMGPLSEQLSAAGADVRQIEICRLTKTCNPFLLLTYYFSWIRGVRQLTALIRETSSDLVHANSNTAQIYAGPAAKQAGVPCIWHCRDLVHLGFLFRWMAARAARVIAISKSVEKHLLANGVAAESVRMIYNTIDTDTFRAQGKREAALSSLGVPSAHQVLAMIGQMVPWKNHDMFISCARMILKERPNTIFVIIGGDIFGDHGSYESHLRHRAERELPGKVIFTGYSSDIRAALEGVDVVLHTASREPFGRSVLEAMAMEKPVVAIDTCGPAEIISSGEDGLLVPADDIDAMTKAAVRLLTDSSLCQRIGEAARRKVETQFSTRDGSSAILDLYWEIIEGSVA